MMRLILVCSFGVLLIGQNSALLGQSISGQVLDYKTREPVPYASIYFNNSYRGTTSGLDGFFKLDASNNLGQDIVISSIGYHTTILDEYDETKSYKIFLKEKISDLTEVVVSGSPGLSREQKIKMFRREFLGDSRNGRNCIIGNEEDLTFYYSKSEERLEAFCDKPLIIVNKELGYQITYYLEEFTMFEGNMKYRGYAQFKEEEMSRKKHKKVVKRRKEAYSGSRMEFFRLLWENKLKKSKIRIVDAQINSEIDLYDVAISEELPFKYLEYSSPLRVVKRRSFSTLTFVENKKTLFTHNGFFDPGGILWNGEMSRKRIGDLLPFEYLQKE